VSLEAFHRSRSIEHQPFRAACYAPFVGLAFDVHGTVSVCAFTRATPLGHVGDAPLLDLWRGHAADALRRAVLADDLDRFCSRCAEEIDGGNLHGVLARGFDQFTAAQPPWPTRMEFALTNACNLQCVMCSGEYSSAIRSRREGLPPLPDRYGEAFLDELEPFLPHLRQARFLGGEPFLAEVNFRIWERMIATGTSAECNVTTNGTQWTPRMERVLDELPFSVGISIDGASAATVESIRVGAGHGRILRNVDRFLTLRDRKGTSISLTYCLMVENWRELGPFLRFADERDCDVYVNTVRQPPVHSLYHLSRPDLAAVVGELDRTHDEVADALGRNREVWIEQTGRLRRHLADLDEDPGDGGQWDRLARALVGADDEQAIAAVLGREVSVLETDRDDVLVGGDEYLGIDVRELHGLPAGRLLAVVAARYGHRADVLAEAVVPGTVARVVRFDETVVATVARRHGDGSRRLAAVQEAGGQP
jgi:MoaA/NifB/PqqE/SkfB family radical SAM enzyme